MVSAIDFGTDISSEWTFDEKGDLKLISFEDNIVQSVNNRLNCFYDSLDLIYDEYGSFLHSYLSWKAEEDTLEFINLEIEEVLSQDPRLTDCTVVSDFNNDEGVDITITTKLNEDEELELNLVLGNEGVTTTYDTEEEE